MNLHFISGLPRSGSTLLAAMLRQNSKFYASIASPLAPMYNALFHQMGVDNEAVDFINDRQRKTVLRGLFQSFYWDENIPGHSTIFDTSRSWTARYHELFELFPDAKMLVLVRPVNEILNSFERIYRANPLLAGKMFGWGSNSTRRCNQMLDKGGVIGSAIQNTKDAFFNGPKDRILFLRYSTLVKEQFLLMGWLHRFFGIEPCSYEEAVSPIPHAQAFDARLGMPGLHEVSSTIATKQDGWLIPPDIIEQNRHSAFWDAPELNRQGITVL